MHKTNLPEDFVNKYHLPFSQYRTLSFILLISLHAYFYTKDSVSMHCRFLQEEKRSAHSAFFSAVGLSSTHAEYWYTTCKFIPRKKKNL